MAADGNSEGPKFGRRAGGGDAEPMTGWASSGGGAEVEPSRRRQKPASSWMDEASDAGGSAASGGGGGGAEGGNDLEGIEELHDDHPTAGDTDLTMKVAHAPSGPTRKVQSLGELNTQARLTGLSASGMGSEADLALLTATLADPGQVKEADEVWDADKVLQDVAQQIAAEKEAAREAAGGGSDA